MDFIKHLKHELNQKKNRELALPMENYMKNNFSFLGIKATERRTIFKTICQAHKEEIKTNYRELAKFLFEEKEREFHMCAQELLVNNIKKNYVKEDIQLIEYFITTHSWWDSVDYLAKYLLGHYLIQFPEETFTLIERFSASKNMWLNRSAILFQLDYKTTTNFDLLKSICENHKHSNEFFIQKAIGWALRDYSRFNPKGVLDFVEHANLKPLSKREAIRNI